MTDTINYTTLYKEVQQMKADITAYRKLAEEDGKIDDQERATLDTMMANIKKAEERLNTMLCTDDTPAPNNQPLTPSTPQRVEQWLKDNWKDGWTEQEAIQAVKQAITLMLNEDMIKPIYQRIASTKTAQNSTTPANLGNIDLRPDPKAYFEQLEKEMQKQLKLAKPWIRKELNSNWSEDDAVKAIRAKYNTITEEAARKLVQDVVKETGLLLAPKGMGMKTGVLVEYNGQSTYLNFPKLKHSFKAGIAKFTLSASPSGKLTFSVELQAGKKSYITIEAKGKVKYDKLAKGKPGASLEPSGAGIYWHTISGTKAFDTPLGMQADLERKGNELAKALSNYKKSPGDLGKAQQVLLKAEALHKTMINNAKLLKKSPNFTVGAEYLILKGAPDNKGKETKHHVFGITLTWHF